MSRHDLLDEFTNSGTAANLEVPEKFNKEISRATVIVVLQYRLSHADLFGRNYAGTATIAKVFGFARSTVQLADEVCQALGLIARTGRKRERGAVEYLCLPSLWKTDGAPGQVTEQVTGQMTGQLTGQLTGQMTGIPVTKGKGKEKKKGNMTRASAKTAPPAPPETQTMTPSPCPKHPNGWHHDEPCHTCRKHREADERRTVAHDERPSWSGWARPSSPEPTPADAPARRAPRAGDPRPCDHCGKPTQWACVHAVARKEFAPHEYQAKGAKKKTGDEIVPPTGPQMAPTAPVRRSNGRMASDEHQSLGMGSDDLETAAAGVRASLDALAARWAV